jgi:large subunit ribosomal protein L7/L12
VPELDSIEREERYKSRVTRTLLLTTLLVVLFFGGGYWLTARRQKETAAARALAETARIEGERLALMRQYSADSTAAAARVTAFSEKYAATDMDGGPIVLVKLQRGANVPRTLERVWAEYVRVVAPDIDSLETREWFRAYYVDAMNRTWYNSAGTLSWEGETQPTAILLPDTKQKGKELQFETPSFAQIARGQEAAGIRAIEALPADSLAASQPVKVAVVLLNGGADKAKVVEIIREITGLGETEAVALVDGAPKTIKQDVNQAVAAEIKRRIEEAGGSIELQ